MKKLISSFIPLSWRVRAGQYQAGLENGLFSLPGVGRWLWKRRLSRLESVPRTLCLEVTSICNAKCIMCPRHDMDRKMELMPFDMYSRLIEEAKELGVRIFALNGYGEIFTARQDYAKYISHLLGAIPQAKVIINSNGSLLDEAAARFLIDTRVDTINVDIDGATKATFEKIRENLHYETVVGNVKRLLKMRRDRNALLPKVRVGMIRQPANAHEWEQFKTQWQGVADFLGDDFMVSRGGSIPVTHPPDVNRACWYPWSEMNIWSNGDVVLCCDDWNGAEVMGSVKTQGLSDIWNGHKYRSYREHHVKGTAGQIKLCAACDFARPGPAWFQEHIRK